MSLTTLRNAIRAVLIPVSFDSITYPHHNRSPSTFPSMPMLICSMNYGLSSTKSTILMYPFIIGLISASMNQECFELAEISSPIKKKLLWYYPIILQDSLVNLKLQLQLIKSLTLKTVISLFLPLRSVLLIKLWNWRLFRLIQVIFCWLKVKEGPNSTYIF